MVSHVFAKWLYRLRNSFSNVIFRDLQMFFMKLNLHACMFHTIIMYTKAACRKTAHCLIWYCLYYSWNLLTSVINTFLQNLLELMISRVRFHFKFLITWSQFHFLCLLQIMSNKKTACAHMVGAKTFNTAIYGVIMQRKL